ncbi:MAG TPA: C-GCAxxG-C-C family protein [Anaerovoracaceae bacterium]|nr:C-GCAxxG-C-C family protein [Anaerovoracaceae bacterium]
MATAFGGGIGGQGLLCGALQSSFMVLSLKYGRKNPHDDRKVLYEKTGRLMNRFRKKYGTLNCKGIRVIPEFLDDPEKVAKMKSVYHETVCSELVGNVAEWLLEELTERE